MVAPQPQTIIPQYIPPARPDISPIAKKNETLAILSLCLSLAPVVLIFIPGLNFFALLIPIAGIILGFIAKSKIHHHPDKFAGSGMATGGIISGFVIIGLIIIVVIVLSIITTIAGAVTSAATNILTQTISNLISQLFSNLK